MKKRLESELISIAHRILKLKNKSEVDQLYKESQKLYETLSVLKFYQDNFESVKSDVDEVVLEEKLKESLEVEIAPAIAAEVNEEDVEPIAEVEAAPEIEEEVEEQIESEDDPSDSELAEQIIVSEASEEVIEEQSIDEEEPIANEESAFKPIFELETEEEEQEQQDVPAEVAFESQPVEKLEDHIGKYTEPVFVKTNEVSLFTSDSIETEEAKQTVAEAVKGEPKSDAFNEMTTKSIAIGLNDRIGFVQHLFNDSNEDFNLTLLKKPKTLSTKWCFLIITIGLVKKIISNALWKLLRRNSLK
jgi:hypothetical protein